MTLLLILQADLAPRLESLKNKNKNNLSSQVKVRENQPKIGNPQTFQIAACSDVNWCVHGLQVGYGNALFHQKRL